MRKAKFKVGEKVRAAHFPKIETISRVKFFDYSKTPNPEDRKLTGYYFQLKGKTHVLGVPSWWNEGNLHKIRKSNRKVDTIRKMLDAEEQYRIARHARK